MSKKMEKPESPRQQLLLISKLLLTSEKSQYNSYEMEAKFGTKGIKYITKIDYDNVIKKLLSSGFISTNHNGDEGDYSLKIQPEIFDAKTGEYRTSDYDFDRFRIEIEGIVAIQEYCSSDDLKRIIEEKGNRVKIIRKKGVSVNETLVQSADFDDFNFRVAYKLEESIGKRSKIATEIIDNWQKSKKIFRYINRVSFQKPGLPFRVDISIVRSSSKNERGRLIKTYNVKDSNVFNNPEFYEIEVEVLNDDAKKMYQTPEELVKGLEKVTKIVLCGLQKTNYPISYKEQRSILQLYMKMLHEENEKKKNGEYVPKQRIYPSDFIGPSSKTLQVKNIGPVNKDSIAPNITEPFSYCVTDKADGDRHLMYVSGNGKIYLINTNMDVLFTGAKTDTPECFDALIDGELILHDKNDRFINTFAAFDIYFYNNKDIRARPFVQVPTKDKKYFEDGCRLPMLKEYMKILKPISVNAPQEKDAKDKSAFARLVDVVRKESRSPMTFITKNFYPAINPEKDNDKYNIFDACNYILQRIQEGLYDYNTDGLIFTPTLLGVGGNSFLEAGPLAKKTWEYSFKWKPAEFNTIDFLVFTKKGTDGKDIVNSVFEGALISQSKTLVLCVGFDERQHGYINPCQDLLDDKIPKHKDVDDEDKYKPKQFYPSDPYDETAGLCNIILRPGNNNNGTMVTEEGQVFRDETIVEFRYDIHEEGLWRWKPLRVRYDKTAEYRQGLKQYGNDYRTADSNWHSIHNPITQIMIRTGKDIPSETVSGDVYYNRVSSEKLTKGMRDFHNLVVKKMLIQNVSKKGDMLIDYACGKGGDFPKWIGANLSFVFGIDIAKENIENRLDGACARYLSFRRDFKTMPYALFVNGDSSKNIREGKAMYTDKAIAITKSVFGETGSDKKIGPAVERQYGKASEGFHVSSCQFAIHYMFKDKSTFYNFLRNLAECTKLNGYFIGTTYDGRTIFNMLKQKQEGEMVEIYTEGKKVWSITKDYDTTEFPNNDSCLGKQISVYQDSINQTFPEYLVNHEFLTNELEKYGFALVHRDDAKNMGLPEGSGMFIELHKMMMDEIKRNPQKEKEYGDASSMKKYEMDISFLNRYFVYKKIRTINAQKLTKAILEQIPNEYEFETEETRMAQRAVQEAEASVKKTTKGKRIAKKIMLQEATEAIEEGKEEQPMEMPKEKEPEIKTKTKTTKTTTKPKKVTRKIIIDEEQE